MTLRLCNLPTRLPRQYPRVMPHCVFAAGRKAFDVSVHGFFTPDEAKQAIFDALPLVQHGWRFHATKIKLVGNALDGDIWRVEKNSISPQVDVTGERTSGTSEPRPQPRRSGGAI